MKLSEAIRLGSLLKPQGFYKYLSKGGACALGAAGLAAGWLDFESWAGTTDFLVKRFPLLTTVRPDSACPIRCEAWYFDVRNQIAHLNDSHRWSRERIADWIESIEPAEGPSEQAEAELAVQVPA